VSVDDLDQSIGFYSTLFATKPSAVRSDYAKWMLDDPTVNFAISARGRVHVGVDHLGIQVDDEAELGEVYDRLKAAEGPVVEQGAVTCCYHQSEKSWITDPTGIHWEAFLTLGETTTYGASGLRAAQASTCCGEGPAASATDCCALASTSACCQLSTAAE
jgi:catechol 2,3-dioxygenase-like lactoylglutathione lyase family enzyme